MGDDVTADIPAEWLKKLSDLYDVLPYTGPGTLVLVMRNSGLNIESSGIPSQPLMKKPLLHLPKLKLPSIR